MIDLDLVLAILHHLFVFALFAVLCAEFVTVRRGMEAAAVARVAAVDARYGALAILILIVGFARAIFAAKGWDYYAHSVFFWAKIGTFVAIGLLSVPPTLACATEQSGNGAVGSKLRAHKLLPPPWSRF